MRSYLIACTVGALIGIVTLISVAAFPLESLPERPWAIIGWDTDELRTNSIAANLIHRALALRMAHLFLEQGLGFISAPVAVFCTLVWLDERGKKIFAARLIKDGMIFALISWFASLIGGCAISFSEPCRTGERFITVWFDGFFFAYSFFRLGCPVFALLTGALCSLFLNILKDDR